MEKVWPEALKDLVNVAMEMGARDTGNEVEGSLSENMVDAIINRHGIDTDEAIDRLLDNFTSCRSSIALRSPFQGEREAPRNTKLSNKSTRLSNRNTPIKSIPKH